MSECDRKNPAADPPAGSWHAWGTPVGLGSFFVLVAIAVDLIRIAFE